MMRGFRVIMIGDGNATRNDEEHMSTLVSFHQTFGDIRSTDEPLSLLTARASARILRRAIRTVRVHPPFRR